MMRFALLVLAGLAIVQAGCTMTPKNEPKTLNEWGQLSRPQF